MRAVFKYVRFALGVIFFACESVATPKPKAYLRLEYPRANYKLLKLQMPFVFQVSDKTTAVQKKKNWLDIKYPKIKATLMLTYKPIKNNLKELLQDTEKLTFKHVIKADDISSITYENEDKKIFGKLYRITGNAASQLQFHVSDYKKHFVSGVLYFYAKPNYDSILPAVNYLEKDIKHLINSFQWK